MNTAITAPAKHIIKSALAKLNCSGLPKSFMSADYPPPYGGSKSTRAPSGTGDERVTISSLIAIFNASANRANSGWVRVNASITPPAVAGCAETTRSSDSRPSFSRKNAW